MTHLNVSFEPLLHKETRPSDTLVGNPSLLMHLGHTFSLTQLSEKKKKTGRGCTTS